MMRAGCGVLIYCHELLLLGAGAEGLRYGDCVTGGKEVVFWREMSPDVE